MFNPQMFTYIFLKPSSLLELSHWDIDFARLSIQVTSFCGILYICCAFVCYMFVEFVFVKKVADNVKLEVKDIKEF